MPIYEYQCPKCGEIFEEWVNIGDAEETQPCPKCGAQARHIISNTSFVLKGGGWYVTDYGYRKNASEGAANATGGSASTGAPAAAGTEAPATPAPAAPAPSAGKESTAPAAPAASASAASS